MQTTEESTEETTVEKIEFPVFSEDPNVFNAKDHLWVNVLLGEEHKVRKCFFRKEDIGGTYTIFRHLAIAIGLEDMKREAVLGAFVKKYSHLKTPNSCAMQLLETELEGHLSSTSFSPALRNFTIAMIKGKVAEAWEAQEKNTEVGKVL